jgi:hypothetical protein
MVFQNQQLNPIQIAISILEFTSELNCSNHSAIATVTMRFDAEFWCPPPPGVMNLNLNVDGGYFKESEFESRDHKGVLELSKVLFGWLIYKILSRLHRHFIYFVQLYCNFY